MVQVSTDLSFVRATGPCLSTMRQVVTVLPGSVVADVAAAALAE